MKNKFWAPHSSSNHSLIYEYIPDDSSAQSNAMKEAIKILNNYKHSSDPVVIVDIGCGDGNSFEIFKHIGIEFKWTGIDIADSPEVSLRLRNDLNFKTYDGQNIPLPNDSVDFIYSHQVFEHVRYPQELLKEVFRVLKTGGYFVGSTSQLEPFHSRSFWNYTPFGFAELLKNAGFHNIKFRPGIDGATLIIRRLFMLAKMKFLFNWFFKHESPLNLFLETVLRLIRVNIKKRNAIKLVFSGQFVFLARER